MTHFLFLILVGLGAVLYFMTPVERTRYIRLVVVALRDAKDVINLEGQLPTQRVIATPALIALGAIIFLFVHSPLLELLISAVCLWQIGLILERLVGRVAFITVYVASGVAAGVAVFAVSPEGMNVGMSGSVLGLYGLLLVTSIWSLIKGSSHTIPLNVTKRLAPVAAVFVLYKLMTTGLWSVAELSALACGLIGGIVVARDMTEDECTPRMRPLATAMAAIVTVVTLYAVFVLHRPLAVETLDVRSEIDRVIAVEARTTSLYDKEVERFRKGRITQSALATVIEKTIVPELHVVAGRLRTLQDVPPEHLPLIATAQNFLKLRNESWRLRAGALHNSDMRGLRQADIKEQVSREAFHRLSMPLPLDSTQPSS